MAAKMKRLSARTVETLTKPGRHADGGNLYLNVTATGAKSWIFLYRFGGKQREMGLGPALDVPLAKAREIASRHRQGLLDGVDPIAARSAAVTVPAFGAFALELLDTVETQWSNPKHRAQWRNTLTTYAAPIWDKPVDGIGIDDVLAVLKPIWTTKPETASRVRGRIATVLDAAKARRLRSGENPAAWTGNLKNLLPSPAVLSRGHHAAMAIDEVPVFLAKLHTMAGVAARGLEFTILTAARSGETMGATWPEIDLERAVWTIPALRMKAKREHRVPLVARALAILSEMEASRHSDYVFPGMKAERPLSSMAFDMTLRRASVEVTTHGFRSSFRDWVGERTTFPAALAEAALAHLVGDETERAYRRGDALEKRRRLMNAWASFCLGVGKGTVIPLSSQRATHRHG